MANPAQMFAPLRPDEVSPSIPQVEKWKAILRVPKDVPHAFPIHSLGAPSIWWAYRDAAGNLMGFAVRFDPPAGKQILPLTFCEGPNGRREWRWQGFPEPRPLYGLDRLAQNPGGRVLVVEGEKSADAAARMYPDLVVVTWPGGAKALHKVDWSPLEGRDVILWPDADDPGRKAMDALAAKLSPIHAAAVAVVDVPADFPEGWDLADDPPAGWDAAMLQAMVEMARPVGAEPDAIGFRHLRSFGLAEFLAMEIPPRGMVMDPIIPTQGIAMIYSKRGVGKTFVSLGIAFAAAVGGKFLRWNAPKPSRVLYVDGEMPGRALQERLAYLVEANDAPLSADMLRLIPQDLNPEGIPDLAGEEGRAAIEAEIAKGCDLLILDNLSTLCPSVKENDADSWGPVQGWLLSLRRRGVSVLLIHHAGKAGSQRGTSRREDVLDTVIALRHPDDYRADEGARFEVHLEKARSVIGEAAKSFEARYEVSSGAASWTMRDLEDATLARILGLDADGLSLREITEETGISKSRVQRMLAQHKNKGLA